MLAPDKSGDGMSEEERTLNDELDEGGQESDDDVAEVGTDDNGPETVSEGANDDPEAVDRPLSERTRLPVLPLRGTVTFPAVAAPIAAGREMTIKAIDAAIAGKWRNPTPMHCSASERSPGSHRCSACPVGSRWSSRARSAVPPSSTPSRTATWRSSAGAWRTCRRWTRRNPLSLPSTRRCVSEPPS